MNRKSKLITIALALVFCISMFAVSVFAVENVADNTADDTTSFEPIDSSDSGSATDPSYDESDPTDPYNTDDTLPDDSSDATDPSYDEPDTTEPYSADDTLPDDSSEPDYTDDTQSNTDYQNPYDGYVGGGQTYVVPETTAPPAPLYDIKEEVDGKELNSNDWNDIAKKLQNAGGEDDDGDDFGFIKNNSSTTDNGDWLLIGGVLCLILSAAGIIYVTASTVKRKKSFSVASATGGRYAVASPSGGKYSKDDYGDGFKSASGKKPSKRGKFDTADVKLDRTSQNRYKNSGRRYK